MTQPAAKHSPSNSPDYSKARLVRRGSKGPVHLPLKVLREAAGFTQSQVAKATGMAQGDVSVLEREASLDRREVRTLRQYLAAIGDDIEIAALSSLGHRIVIVGANAQAPLRIVPGQHQSESGQPQIETTFADAMTKAAADGSLAAWWFAPKSRRRKTDQSAAPHLTFPRLYDAVKEAHQAHGIYRDERSRMLSEILPAVEAAVYSKDLKALKKLHRTAVELRGVEPVRFFEWKDFERWLLQQARTSVTAGITLPELAAAVRLALYFRAPRPSHAHDSTILEAWAPVMARGACTDGVNGKGKVLDDRKIVIDLLTAAMRDAGISSEIRKWPFRWLKTKDKRNG